VSSSQFGLFGEFKVYEKTRSSRIGCRWLEPLSVLCFSRVSRPPRRLPTMALRSRTTEGLHFSFVRSLGGGATLLVKLKPKNILGFVVNYLTGKEKPGLRCWWSSTPASQSKMS
jgi:hypothetical protein